ncbi:hypothetical protein JOJ86_005932 [Rhodococcus percolatus]|uniref:hypothetical protein n=1 Tax=Rhodococcus opacus TaxID=37919 RepID=UPI0015F8902D|nr:hypothetical protein [Rhodococcus opacus]MBA8964654.1 hypothetical protein [Rhodococcus opacus]MBP2208206.1 hypothetical protein [Rhodococcus opacus]
MRLPTPLYNLTQDAVIDLRNAGSGALRTRLVRAVFVIPALVAIAAFCAWHFWDKSITPSSMFPAAAIFAGALMGTVSMLFTRVKDVAAAPKVAVGRDPVYQATVVFRTALYCAEVALSLNGVLLLAVLLPEGLPVEVAGAVAIGMFVHLGMRVALLLQGLRAQMMHMAGSRAQHPLPRIVRDRTAS